VILFLYGQGAYCYVGLLEDLYSSQYHGNVLHTFLVKVKLLIIQFFSEQTFLSELLVYDYICASYSDAAKLYDY
jgi:hypothetical protein